METTNSIVEKIHYEVDTSYVELLNSISLKNKELEQTKNSIILEDESISLRDINALGLNKSKISKKYKEKEDITNLLYENINSKDEIERIINKYHPYKIISLRQMMSICEKYNLYYGPIELYKEDIPIEKFKELKQYNKIKSDDHKYATKDPLYEIPFDINRYCRQLSYYITAPQNYFELGNDYTFIGREATYIENSNIKIFKIGKHLREERARKKAEDPIIFQPIISDILNDVILVVITKWGIEASIPEISNPIEN